MNKKACFWIVTTLIALLVMVVTIIINIPKTPEFVPPEFEENAKTGFPSLDEEFGFADAHINEYKIFVCSEIFLENGKAKVFFTNCEENTVWAKIRIINEEGNVIGESGLLNPGEYIEEILISDILQKGEKVKIKVMLYEPETYRSEGVILLEANIK